MKLQMNNISIGLFFTFLISITACQSNLKKSTGSNQDDIEYSRKLWKAMLGDRLVGSRAIALKPFFGGAKPHGMVLEIYSGVFKVADHNGFLVLKKNYNGRGVSVESVKRDRKKYLSSITIMYQREAEYDDDNLNMFWAKYKPDGTLFVKEMMGNEMQLAGRLIKGKDGENNKGCLHCHASAGGGDYIFYPNIKLPNFEYFSG